MRRRPTAGLAAFGLVAALAGAACSERASMESDSADANRTSMQSGGNDANRTTVTVTGCFQEASGFNNFVLTNVTEGTPEQRAQGYRIERGRDTEQHVGKQVRVTGWVDSGNTASMQGTGTSSGTQYGSGQYGTSSTGAAGNTGSIGSGHTGSTSTGSTGAMGSGSTGSNAQGQGGRAEYGDYPELHVQSIERVGENCSNTSGNSGR